MNDAVNSFDERLSQELSHLPLPDQTVQEITPWRQAAQYIAVGLVLSAFRLELLYLQYIGPAVGALLLYLGFRTLRRCNRAFGLCFLLAAAKALLFLTHLLFLATPLGLNQAAGVVLGYTATGITLLLLFSYRLALRRAFRGLGETQEGDPLLGALIWYALVTGLALSPLAHSWLAFGVMLIFFISAIKGLNRLNASLDVWGYSVKAAPVLLSGTAVSWLYIVCALTIVTAGGLISNNVVPEATPRTEQTVPADIQAQLTELGFPQYALADMTAEDVAALDGAMDCQVHSETLIFIDNALREEPLEVLTIYTQLPGDRLNITIWFAWQEQPRTFWQDALTLPSHENMPVEGFSGQLLYEKEGVAYTAPLPRLSLDTRTASGWFGPETYDCISAALGYPHGAENARGYLSVICRSVYEGSWMATAGFSYYHQRSPLTLPYRDTPTALAEGGLTAIQQKDSLYCYSYYDSLDHRQLHQED